MKEIRAMIVDDHEIIRYGLRKLFEEYQKQYPILVIAEADNGRKAVELVRQHSPDVVIMDISMPEMNGVEATRQIHAACPRCRIVILTSYIRYEFLRELIQAGISGFVLKSHVLNDLFDAICSAMRGEVYLCSKVAGLMTMDYARVVTSKEQIHAHQLSPRQREVLQLITEGRGTKEIAILLGVSCKAIESTRHRIMQKLEIDNLPELTKYALQEGLTTLDF